MAKTRLLLIAPGLTPPGGCQCVVAWALQALREQYAVDLLTWLPVDFDAVNRTYGTDLVAGEFKHTCPPAWLRRLVSLDPDPYSIQPMAVLMRMAKNVRSRYSLLISFINEVDFNWPTIQYVHFPYLAPHYLEANRLNAITSLRGRCRAEVFRRRPWRVISGLSFERMKANPTLVNSEWVGEVVRQTYGIEPATLYPPVPGHFPNIPWEERENGFICIGRFSEEKRYDWAIEILTRLRARGHAVHLHLVGGHHQEHRAYRDRIAGWARGNADWMTLHENVPRTELVQLVARHRYGIHANPAEHFGIAVAEQVRGGCVVFVPNGGGQVEIVARDRRLLYSSIEDAVEKISRVLDDADLQRELRAKLAEHAGFFAPERFMNRLCELVEQYLPRRLC